MKKKNILGAVYKLPANPANFHPNWAALAFTEAPFLMGAILLIFFEEGKVYI